MASRTSLVRVGAAMLGVSTALMIGALPAAADTGSSASSNSSNTVTGHVVNVDTSTAVSMDFQGSVRQEPADLFKFQISDDPTDLVKAYCVGFTLPLDKKSLMSEQNWDQYPNPNSPFNKNNSKINWILHHSYPAVSVADLSNALGLTLPMTAEEAVGATQAAVWNFSDGATLDSQNDPVEVKLYNYLVGNANTGVAQSTLSISPKKVTGTTGKLVGPFTVSTNLTGLKLADVPAGVSVVDANGKALDAGSLTDGSKFYLDMSSSATVTSADITLSGSVDAGRLFTGVNDKGAPVQPMITANDVPIVATAAAAWTQGATTTTPTTPAAGATPTTGQQQGLAYTGVSATGPIVLGILLIAAGGLFLLVQRRLKRAA